MSAGDSAREHKRQHPRHEVFFTLSGEWACSGTADEDCDANGDRD